ncbi:hypothetical protein DPMN_191878 [Dreissena polymorpha]|uniref:Uncharacterized protein n=1 Tax=Dreissena polymorpha TaxID=45954 RepID=A0A9D3XYB4_DREPO|nr:hypothetical protein DPMN_191878 [Dreissena polymorpha]
MAIARLQIDKELYNETNRSKFAHLRGSVTNQMWTNGRRTKTNAKTSSGQSAIFQLVREINKTNAKNEGKLHTIGGHFHDWAKNVTFRETNVLTKFHENWAKNVTSRVEKCPAHWRPCFSPIWTIFELVRDINKTI